jgi:hypothetical protein
MRPSRGDLISFNSFLSTSTNPSISENFTVMSMGKPGIVTVLFLIIIDPSVTTMPYANTQTESVMQDESEILFSMNSVFRVVSTEWMPNKSNNLRVQLKLTSDNGQQLRCLTDYFER